MQATAAVVSCVLPLLSLQLANELLEDEGGEVAVHSGDSNEIEQGGRRRRSIRNTPQYGGFARVGNDSCQPVLRQEPRKICYRW